MNYSTWLWYFRRESMNVEIPNWRTGDSSWRKAWCVARLLLKSVEWELVTLCWEASPKMRTTAGRLSTRTLGRKQFKTQRKLSKSSCKCVVARWLQKTTFTAKWTFVETFYCGKHFIFYEALQILLQHAVVSLSACLSVLMLTFVYFCVPPYSIGEANLVKPNSV